MKHLRNLFLLALIGLFSCEQVIDIEVPAHQPELVMSSFYRDGDEKLRLFLYNSLGILESDMSVGPVENATVELFEDDQLLTTLPFNMNNQRYVVTLDNPLQSGREYRLQATAEGFTSVFAKQQMPDLVPIINATYEADGGRDAEGNLLDEVEVEFQEPAGTENYYEIKLFVFDRADPTIDFRRYITSLDPVLEEGREDYVFSDALINGENYKLKLLLDHVPFDALGIRVVLNCISRDQYLMSKSLRAQTNAQDNPFAEPVIVHSNVENGQGVFGMYIPAVFDL